MFAKCMKCMTVTVLAVGMVFVSLCSDAVAQPHGGNRPGVSGFGGGPGGGFRGWDGGGKHYYRNGSWYRHGWLGFDIAVSALALGALIDSLPPRHTTVVVAGSPYYYYDGYYYQPYPRGGYVVVPPPVLAQPAMVMAQPAPVAAPVVQLPPQIQDVSTINIPNSRDGYTSVTLRKAGTGYIGPQGEYYSDNPTVQQLKVLYGK